MRNRNALVIGGAAVVLAVQAASAQFFTNNLQEEASVTNLFNQSHLYDEGYWLFSTNNVITVRNPTNLAATVERTNYLAGASTMSTSTTSDGGEGRSTLYTQFGGYSTNDWKAHVAIETPAAGDPSKNYIFFGMGQSPGDGDRAFFRMQYGAASSGQPRVYVNGTVVDSDSDAVTAPGTDVYLTHISETDTLIVELDHWASDGTRSNGVDLTLIADISSLSFTSDTEASLFFTAQSTVTFSDFWVQPYTTEAPGMPLNVYAWPDDAGIVSVYWDEEVLSTDGYNVYRSIDGGDTYARIAVGVMDTSYVDSDVTSGEIYYYKVAGTNEYGEGLLSDSEYAVPSPYLILGTEATDVEKSKYELFDDDVDTLFGLDASGYAGLDYGEGNEQEFVKIRYHLRDDAWAYYDDGRRALIRSAGCMFQGANSADFSDAVTLYTLTTNNTVLGEWNECTVTNSTPFRYVRYQSGGSFNKINTMAELDFITASDFTANGTPIYWMEDYGLTDADDEVDSDGDGLLTWEEYVAGTDPTNAASVLTIYSGSNTVNGLVLTWQSVEGKSYSIITNSSLTLSARGTIAAGITGLENATSYTTTVSGAGTVFYEIGVE